MRPNPAPAPPEPRPGPVRPVPPAPEVGEDRGGLRPVTAGLDPETWPIRVPLREGESLTGWWVRLAHRYGVAPAGLFRELGMRIRSYAPPRIAERLARPNRELNARTGTTTAARRAALAAEHAARQRYAGLVHRYQAQGIPAAPRGSRFCPTCLAEDRLWRPDWLDPLAVSCPHHQVLLVEACPGCGQQPFSSIAWVYLDRDPACCTEYLPRVGGGPRSRRHSCNTDLTTAPTTPAPPGLGQTTTLLQALGTTENDLRDLAGQIVDTSEAAQALVLLTGEALHHAVGTSRTATIPDIAHALHQAHQVLEQPSLIEAAQTADRFGLLAVHGRLVPIGPARALQTRPIDPLLHAIRLHGLHEHLPATTQMAFRIGSDYPRTPEALRHRHTPTPTYVEDWKLPPAPLSAIPQLWWPTALAGYDLTGDEQARFAISIAVACVGRAITVATAAEYLGAPKSASARVTSTWKRMATTTGWPALRHAILDASARLATTPPPIDYATRRDALATPAHLDALASEWEPGTVFTDPERLWLWTYCTEGSPRLTPTDWGGLRTPHFVPRPPIAHRTQLILQALTNHTTGPLDDPVPDARPP